MKTARKGLHLPLIRPPYLLLQYFLHFSFDFLFTLLEGVIDASVLAILDGMKDP